jgi:hypothetical protein
MHPYLLSYSMNPLCGQKNLSWLDARIRETESRIISQKKQLGELEGRGINSSQACQRLAITTNYLKILNVRRKALLENLQQAHAVSRPDH